MFTRVFALVLCMCVQFLHTKRTAQNPKDHATHPEDTSSLVARWKTVRPTLVRRLLTPPVRSLRPETTNFVVDGVVCLNDYHDLCYLLLLLPPSSLFSLFFLIIRRPCKLQTEAIGSFFLFSVFIF